MKLRVKQEYFKADYEYKIYFEDKLICVGKANRTILPKLRNISLYDADGNILCSLKQESYVKLLIEKINPILGFCPFIYYESENRKGFLKGKYSLVQGVITGEINNLRISIYAHQGNTYSIYFGDKQIGRIDREAWKEGDGDTYNILYDKDVSRNLIAIISLLIDIQWNTQDNRFEGKSVEYNIQLGGKKLDNDWQPLE